MKKLVLILLLIIPMVAVADRRSDFVNKILEYENTQIDKNAAQINAYGVNQENWICIGLRTHAIISQKI